MKREPLGDRWAISPAFVLGITLLRFIDDTDQLLERGEALRDRTIEDIRRALESAGVEFIAENGGGPGVRLRKAR